MVLSTKIEGADLREAERLSRYAWSLPLKAVGEHHLLVLGLAAITVTYLGILGREGVSLTTAAIMDAVFIAVLLARASWISMRLKQRARKISATAIPVELKSKGLYLLMPAEVRLMPWEQIIDTRAGDRVLLLYYNDPKRQYRRKRYLIVPIQALSYAERNDLLLTIPENRRGKSVHQRLKQWRLA